MQLRDSADPETGERYTVKRDTSEKIASEGAGCHFRITLKPNNPEFEPIVLTSDDEESVQVVAEMLELVR